MIIILLSDLKNYDDILPQNLKPNHHVVNNFPEGSSNSRQLILSAQKNVRATAKLCFICGFYKKAKVQPSKNNLPTPISPM